MPELTYKVVCNRPTAIGLGGQTAIDLGFPSGNRHVVVDTEESDGSGYSAPISEEEANLLQDMIDQTGATDFRVEGPPAPPAAKGSKKDAAAAEPTKEGA